MRLPDVNVLLHAVNEASESHQPAHRWLRSALAGSEPLGFAWVTALGFLRMSTNSRIMPGSLQVSQAGAALASWLAQPCARMVAPGPGHLDRMTALLESAGTSGDAVTDAHLAALAMEQDGEVVSFDRDFARFPGLRWSIPA